ncbi:sugar kinase [Clostridium sediminicola]|uniref:carbohydrate kinase family protein n=1 Tax=Clostridium sediminicola TaxID=3114879 RepID=UPI0031F1D9BF
MTKILCIGHSAYDITLPLEEFPVENRKYGVKTVLECGGGPAGNAAYLIAKWGMSCRYAGILGNDIYGTKIREEYENIGVDLKYLIMDDNSTTPFSFIIANNKNGSRTLFNHKKNNSQLQLTFDDDEPETILVDGHELDASIQAIKKYPNAKSILDAGSYKVANVELARIVDYLVCSEDFVRDYLGLEKFDTQESINYVFKKLEQLNKKNIIITLGEKGSLYKADGKVIHQNTYKVNALDTTGAGDIFHGAFAYCITRGFDIVKSIKISSITAALSVEKNGGRVSIPSIEDVLNLYERGVI